MLDNFRELDFIDQMTALSNIEAEYDIRCLDDLFGLFTAPLGDAAVDTMIRNCLRTLLLGDSPSLIQGLTSPDETVQRFALNLVGEAKLTEAAPILLDLASKTTDPEVLVEILTQMKHLDTDDFLGVFRSHLRNPHPLVAALCIEAVGQKKDANSLPILETIIAAAESDAKYDTCDISTWRAIDALAGYRTDKALKTLTAFIHHRNPTARRTIHEALIDVGVDAIAHITPQLLSTQPDKRIMAANILGFIGHRKGVQPIVQVLENNGMPSPNERFAAYEALGRIASLQAVVALLHGLARETDTLVLTAIITGLNNRMVDIADIRLLNIVGNDPASDHTSRIIDTIASIGATRLFSSLYRVETIGDALISSIQKQPDESIRKAFSDTLAVIGSPRALIDREALLTATASRARAYILAIDDSEAMLSFYRSVATELQIAVSTASNGKEALELLEDGREFDAVIVDMNMPVMDGIEFTQQAKCLPSMMETPILMATTESGRSQAQLARKAGVTMFLKKPFTPDVLGARIDKLLDD